MGENARSLDATAPSSRTAHGSRSMIDRPPFWAFALCALPPALIAVLQLGRIHPDEVYQVLEPGWFRAHGYGVLAWEWRVGLRNWSLPIGVSWILKACALVGIDDPRAYRAVIELPQWLLHAAMLSAVFRIGWRRAGGWGGWSSVALVGLYGLTLVFAGRTMSESISAALLVLAFERLDRPSATPRAMRDGGWGGVLLGLAVVARYGSAVMVIAALGWLIARRRWRVLAACCVGGAVVALGLGALDWATWGQPFHSFLEYVRYNVTGGGAAARFGASPWYGYLAPFASNLPAWAWIGVPLASVHLRPRWSLELVSSVLYLVVLSATAHKEDRFLYPALILLAVHGAPGIAWAVAKLADVGLRATVLAAAVGVGLLPMLWQPDLRGDEFRAIVKATRDGATGLLVIGDGLWGLQGDFYLGKNIPWTECDVAQDARFVGAMRDRRFNRVVSFEDHERQWLERAGFRRVDQLGRMGIYER